MAEHRKPPTYHMLVIIGSILTSDTGKRYGQEIMDSHGISPGTLYPLLHRMEEAGILTSRTERRNPVQLGRPLRTNYRLTEKGKRFGERYNTRVLASNPPLVTFEEFG